MRYPPPNPPPQGWRAIKTSCRVQSRSTLSCGTTFKGRPCTRFFGEATQGLTSANSPFPLADGTEIWLATSYEADRTGQHYQTVVKPDVEVLTDWKKYLSDEDAVLHVGVDWLTTVLSASPPRISDF